MFQRRCVAAPLFRCSRYSDTLTFQLRRAAPRTLMFRSFDVATRQRGARRRLCFLPAHEQQMQLPLLDRSHHSYHSFQSGNAWITDFTLPRRRATKLRFSDANHRINQRANYAAPVYERSDGPDQNRFLKQPERWPSG